MKVYLAIPGHFKSEHCEALTDYYLRLAGKFVTTKRIELALAKSLPEQQAQDQALLKYLEKNSSRAFLAILDEKGTAFSSKNLAAKLSKVLETHSEIVIAVGGAHEYGAAARARANLIWSLSPLTFSHELAATIAAEQIFRVFSILNNHPYHKE